MAIKEKIMALASICDDQDMERILDSDLESIGNYVSAVYAMEYRIPIIRARYEGQNMRDKIMELDENRRMAHERAIMAVKRLNRISKMHGLPDFFPGDTKDRYAIADFCGKMVQELFCAGISLHDLRLKAFRYDTGKVGQDDPIR